jgi:hypothetical protein
MKPILQIIKTHLTEHEVDSYSLNDESILGASITLTHLALPLFFTSDDEGESISISGRLPNRVPLDRRPSVAEFLGRINWGLNRGRFLMDHRDGELCFQIDIDAHNGELNLPRLAQFILLCLQTVDGFYPALMSVLYRDAHPEQAVEQGEAEFMKLTTKKPGKETE